MASSRYTQKFSEIGGGIHGEKVVSRLTDAFIWIRETGEGKRDKTGRRIPASPAGVAVAAPA